MYGNCPITWFSCLQNEIALSTTEAEYIALSTAAREVLSMRTLISELSPVMGISLLNLISSAPFLRITKDLGNLQNPQTQTKNKAHCYKVSSL
eukprot:11829735-Ditylum_brightwellii.AAC.1